VKTTVRVEGLKEIDAALGQLGKATGRNVMRRVAVKRLGPMAETARQLAPDDPATGGLDLKRSIAVSTQLGTRQRKLNRKSKSEVEAHMGPAGPGGKVPPQGVFQEFGTQHHGPQSFMRPAFDQGKDALIDGIGADLWAEIDKAAERNARKAARLAAKG
jgi:HK97 gp10 family phage protein